MQFGQHQFVLQPLLDPEGVNRIVANRFYAVHPQMQGSEQLIRLVGSLNHQLNFAKFVFQENGAVILALNTATFTQHIELE